MSAVFEAARRDRERLWSRERLLSAIDDAGCDAVVASTLPNVIYTARALLAFDFVPTFVLTTASGEQAVVVNEADAPFVREHSPIARIATFALGPRAGFDAVAALERTLRQAGLGQSVVGIELGELPLGRATLLTSVCEQVRWVDAADAFRAARLIKTPAELELLRAAAGVTLEAIVDALGTPEPGLTEKGLAAAIQAGVLRRGADALVHTLVNAGLNSTLVHSLAFDRPLVAGEVVHVDFGARFAGYCTDLARTAVLGTPTPHQLDVHRRLRAAHEAVVDWLRPGITGEEVFVRSETELRHVGLENALASVGHSVGLDLHEGLELSRCSHRALEPGMVICFEPSVVVPGEGRYDIEDMYEVTADGVERLAAGGDGLLAIPAAS